LKQSVFLCNNVAWHERDRVAIPYRGVPIMAWPVPIS